MLLTYFFHSFQQSHLSQNCCHSHHSQCCRFAIKFNFENNHNIVDFNLKIFSDISAAIKTALKQENLNPEIEEKLLQLQRYQEKQMKQEPEQVPPPILKVSPPVITNSRFTAAAAAAAATVPPPPPRKRPLSASKNDDSDWVMETPKRSRPSRNNEHHKKIEQEPP